MRHDLEADGTGSVRGSGHLRLATSRLSSSSKGEDCQGALSGTKLQQRGSSAKGSKPGQQPISSEVCQETNQDHSLHDPEVPVGSRRARGRANQQAGAGGVVNRIAKFFAFLGSAFGQGICAHDQSTGFEPPYAKAIFESHDGFNVTDGGILHPDGGRGGVSTRYSTTVEGEREFKKGERKMLT